MAQPRLRLAVLASHPVQYYAPLFRALAQRLDIHVFYAHKATPEEQSAAGFGAAFDWDLDLLSGYSCSFLRNVARQPHAGRFAGCDTPEVGANLRGGAYGAVLSLGWHLKSLLQGIWAAKRLGIPVLVRGDSHLLTPRSRAKTWIKQVTYPALLRTFDAALTVGKRNRDYYLHYGYPANRMFYSPHCVDTEWFLLRATPDRRNDLRSRLGIAADDKLVLFAGKLVPLKRPLDVVDAVARLRSQGVRAHVAIAGGGELEGTMRAHANANNVPLHFLGFQNQTQMPSVYAAADVLMLPSERETWGLVCNEAIACGTPIVVSDTVGCAPDLAEDGRAGRTFAMGDIVGAAEALASILAAPTIVEALNRKSDSHSICRAADGVISALISVTGRRSGHGFAAEPGSTEAEENRTTGS